MEDFNFASLAPRRGTKPILNPWLDIGTSSMSGGAITWGNIWSGLKGFSNSLKSLGSNIWNSSSGQALRQKLKDSKVQDKIIDGINAGIHGAVDIARQEMDKQIQKRLDETSGPQAPSSQGIKRPLEEELVVTSDEPPSYDDLFPNKTAPPPPLQHSIETKPANVATPIPNTKNISSSLPYIRGHKNSQWRNTLHNIVGLGVHVTKKQRCF